MGEYLKIVKKSQSYRLIFSECGLIIELRSKKVKVNVTYSNKGVSHFGH